jgi:hypothetical protein
LLGKGVRPQFARRAASAIPGEICEAVSVRAGQFCVVDVRRESNRTRRRGARSFDELTDRADEVRYHGVVRVDALRKILDQRQQLLARQRGPTKANERAHDLDVHVDCSLVPEHAPQHRDALLGESPSDVTPTAAATRQP